MPISSNVVEMRPVKVSRQFLDNFELVAQHYNLMGLGEYDLAKQTARADIVSAEICFAALAKEIRDGVAP